MHKKTYLLLALSLLFASATAVGALSAYSLHIKGATSGSFNFGSDSTIYYLSGDFNSWSTNDSSAQFTNITSSMTPEEDKIAEYKLTNLSLDKNGKVKVVDSNGLWHTATYSHCWSDDVSSDESGNYLVPMTSNKYTFFFKVFKNNVYKMYIQADKNVLFFGASSSNGWFNDGAYPKITIKDSNSGNAKNNPGATILTGEKYNDYFYKFTFTDEQYENVLSGGSHYFAYLRCHESDVWNYSSWMQISNNDINNRLWVYDQTWDNWGADSGYWEAL